MTENGVIAQDLLALEYIFTNRGVMIERITSSMGSALLFQSLRQTLDDYHQGADRLGRVIYQCALATATSSSMRVALDGVKFLSSGSQNLIQGSLVTSLAIPIILNLSDIFALPITRNYRREIFVINSHFSSLCYEVMRVAIALICCGTGWSVAILTLAALHAEPVIERLGLPPNLVSIISISNKLIGGVYGFCSGNYLIQGISFFRIIWSIEKLCLLIRDKESEIKSFLELQDIPAKAIATISSNTTLPSRYHLVRDNMITVPPVPSGERIPNFGEMLSNVSWRDDEVSKRLLCRLEQDDAWRDQWGECKDLNKAIDHINQGAKNFSEYIATCPKEIRDRAMWVLINLYKKPIEERIPYLMEMALHMHYCLAGKNAEVETTYGILFNEIDNISIPSRIHQIIQYKREGLFKEICREEISKTHLMLEEKVRFSEEIMKRNEISQNDTLTERVQKCLYYMDSYISYKVWKYREFIVDKFKEKYMNDVHVYNSLKSELIDAMQQKRMSQGFLLTRFLHWVVIKIHEFILSPEVMNIRIASLDRMCREYNTDFILRQFQDSLQKKDVLHTINRQDIWEWFQSDLHLSSEKIRDIYGATDSDLQDTIKDNYILYLLVRIGLLEVSNEFRKTIQNEMTEFSA